MPILVVGDRHDLSTAYLTWCARQRRIEVLELWEDTYGIEWFFEGAIDQSSEVHLMSHGERLSIRDIGGVFVRLNPTPGVAPELLLDEVQQSIYSLERRYGLQFVFDQVEAPVVNRPSRGRSNTSKPYQMLCLERFGFRVPEWCVTNDLARIQSFVAEFDGGAIYKACSGLRAQVRRVDPSLLRRIEDGCCSVLVQRYIPGTDVRVHVVGGRVFGSQIISDAVDYRFEDTATTYQSIPVPDEVAQRCVRHTAAEGLHLAGLDFRLDPDGVWWCLESNPVPTFLPYEAGTGHPIAEAILDLYEPRGSRAVGASVLWQLSSHTGLSPK